MASVPGCAGNLFGVFNIYLPGYLCSAFKTPHGLKRDFFLVVHVLCPVGLMHIFYVSGLPPRNRLVVVQAVRPGLVSGSGLVAPF